MDGQSVVRNKLKRGETVAGLSAVLLFVSMFLHWFGVEYVNNGPLLFLISGTGPGKSAWEALDYDPILFLLTVVATLGTVALRWAMAPPRLSLAADAITAVFGVASALLILHRVFDPPNFGIDGLGITSEGFLRPPIFVALAAAVGVAFGCLWSALESRPWRRIGAKQAVNSQAVGALSRSRPTKMRVLQRDSAQRAN
jgi:hypothetical protein